MKTLPWYLICAVAKVLHRVTFEFVFFDAVLVQQSTSFGHLRSYNELIPHELDIYCSQAWRCQLCKTLFYVLEIEQLQHKCTGDEAEEVKL